MEIRRIETNPTSVAFACVLSISAFEMTSNFGSQFHGPIVISGLETDSPVANTLLVMYVQNRFMDEAPCLFYEMISTDMKPRSHSQVSFH